MSLVSVIIPVYNEAKVLKKLLGNPAFDKYDIIIVDDCSTDLPAYEDLGVDFHLIRHSRNLGQGASLQTGMDYAKKLNSDIVVHLDADGQHDPGEIPSLIEPLIARRADVVIGSRFLKERNRNESGMPMRKLWILYCARIVQFLFTGARLSDSQNGFRALSSQAYNAVRIKENRMAHAIELIQLFKQKKLKVIERPVTIIYTTYSLQKGQKLINSVFIVLNLMLDSFLRIRYLPLFLLLTGIATSALSFITKNYFAIILSVFSFLLFFILIILRSIKKMNIAQTENIRVAALLSSTFVKKLSVLRF